MELLTDVDNNSSTIIDSTLSRFYKSLDTISPTYRVGDAATTLLRIVRHCTQHHHDGPTNPIQNSWDTLVNSGRVQSVLKSLADERHYKETKVRTMPVPFELKLTPDCCSFFDSFKSTLEPVRLEGGYRWGDDELAKEDTTKQLRISSLPLIWFLQPQPSDIQLVDIPPSFSTDDILLDKSCGFDSEYRLEGGILYILEDKEDTDAAHYVPLLRKGDVWYFLDDDNVPLQISSTEALGLLSGDKKVLPLDRFEDSAFVKCFLLVYHRSDFLAMAPRREETEDKKAPVDWVHPEGFVGRVLEIKWSKGKWYKGQVAGYNHQTGQHTVHYNDGDVRTYTLRKKEIKWEG